MRAAGTSLPIAASVAGVLEQQAARRSRGVPTVSVVRGPVGTALRICRRWLATRQQPLLVCTDPDLRALAHEWVVELARERDLIGDAIAKLGSWIGRPPAELRAVLAGKTLADLESLWEALPLDRSSDTISACAALISYLVEGKKLVPEQIFERLAHGVRRNDPLELRVVVALSGLVPTQVWPAIILAPEGSPGDYARWLARVMATAAALVNRLPQLHVAVAAPGDVVDSHLRSAPESQALALLREGMIEVPVVDEAAITRQIRDAGVSVDLVWPTIRRVAAVGADEGLVATLGEAGSGFAGLNQSDAASLDRARSAAERFLHELLDSDPATAGLFELNGALDFRFGTRPVEIDLLARKVQLAVELDGSHWHMKDLEAYRGTDARTGNCNGTATWYCASLRKTSCVAWRRSLTR
jgi:hypothetical protein